MDRNRPLGSFSIIDLIDYPVKESRDGKNWRPSRPIPYYSLKERIRAAWDILTYKADALYW